jgi:hypothetical protein
MRIWLSHFLNYVTSVTSGALAALLAVSSPFNTSLALGLLICLMLDGYISVRLYQTAKSQEG